MRMKKEFQSHVDSSLQQQIGIMADIAEFKSSVAKSIQEQNENLHYITEVLSNKRIDDIYQMTCGFEQNTHYLIQEINKIKETEDEFIHKSNEILEHMMSVKNKDDSLLNDIHKCQKDQKSALETYTQKEEGFIQQLFDLQKDFSKMSTDHIELITSATDTVTTKSQNILTNIREVQTDVMTLQNNESVVLNIIKQTEKQEETTLRGIKDILTKEEEHLTAVYTLQLESKKNLDSSATVLRNGSNLISEEFEVLKKIKMAATDESSILENMKAAQTTTHANNLAMVANVKRSEEAIFKTESALGHTGLTAFEF